jgi:iron complex transport system substrate-binding protein
VTRLLVIAGTASGVGKTTLALVTAAALALATSAHAFTVRDMRSVTVTLAAPPARIVSLVPSATEAIFAIGGANRLAGVTDFCDWPREARRKPRVGGMITPSLESIVALRPDLVVATDEGNSQATFDQLARLGIPIYVVRAHRLDDALGLVARMGELTGRAGGVGPLLERLRARVARVTDAVRLLTYLFRHGPPHSRGTICVRIEGCSNACQF